MINAEVRKDETPLQLLTNFLIQTTAAFGIVLQNKNISLIEQNHCYDSQNYRHCKGKAMSASNRNTAISQADSYPDHSALTLNGQVSPAQEHFQTARCGFI